MNMKLQLKFNELSKRRHPYNSFNLNIKLVTLNQNKVFIPTVTLSSFTTLSVNHSDSYSSVKRLGYSIIMVYLKLILNNLYYLMFEKRTSIIQSSLHRFCDNIANIYHLKKLRKGSISTLSCIYFQFIRIMTAIKFLNNLKFNPFNILRGSCIQMVSLFLNNSIIYKLLNSRHKKHSKGCPRLPFVNPINHSISLDSYQSHTVLTVPSQPYFTTKRYVGHVGKVLEVVSKNKPIVPTIPYSTNSSNNDNLNQDISHKNIDSCPDASLGLAGNQGSPNTTENVIDKFIGLKSSNNLAINHNFTSSTTEKSTFSTKQESVSHLNEIKPLSETALQMQLFEKENLIENSPHSGYRLTFEGIELNRTIKPNKAIFLEENTNESENVVLKSGMALPDDSAEILTNIQTHLVVVAEVIHANTESTLKIIATLTSEKGTKGGASIPFNTQLSKNQPLSGENKAQYASYVLPHQDIKKPDFKEDIDATEYINDPNVQKKLDDMYAFGNRFKSIPYDPTAVTLEDLKEMSTLKKAINNDSEIKKSKDLEHTDESKDSEYTNSNNNYEKDN